MFEGRLENIRKHTPLVHSITNYVTVNDCANILLACGASPIMADEIEEVEEITALCDGLNLNLGTLNKKTISAMFLAARKANALDRPILLDPVGAGASRLRTQTALELLDKVHISVLRGNVSEIKALTLGSSSTKGVDANFLDAVNEETLDAAAALTRSLSAKTGAIVAMTGAIDLVSDAKRTYVIRNGHPLMGRITGAGCMLSAMATAYLAANREVPLEAVSAAVCAMGVCGQIAIARMAEGEGNATYRNRLIDAVFNLSPEGLGKDAQAEMLS